MAGKHGAVDIMQNIDIKDYEHNNLLAYGKLVTFDTTMESYPDKRTRTIRVLLPESYDGVKRFLSYTCMMPSYYFLNPADVQNGMSMNR